MSRATTSEKNVELAPLLRMPPEMHWRIVQNLENPEDLSAVAKLDGNISDQAHYVIHRRKLAEELAQSVEAENIEGIQKALDSGASINGFHERKVEEDQPAYTYTPLQLAAHLGRVGAAKYLLTRGARVDFTNFDGDTAFHVAVDANKLKVAQLLFEYGANANCKNKDGDTPLHFAVLWNQADMMRFLLHKCKADIHVESKMGETPFILATREGYSKALNILALCKDNDINKADHAGRTALYYAVEKKDGHLVGKLLGLGAEVDQNPHVIETSPLALTVQSHWDNLEIFRLLHERSGAINAGYPDKGRTILHLAAEEGRLYVVEYLISQKDVDLDQRDSNGNNALIIAIMADKPKIVELLCRKGSNVHQKNDFRRSALQIAKERNHQDIITYLVQAGSKHSIMEAE